MWNFIIPPKMKVFFGKVCTHCLPTADMLQAKHIFCSLDCHLCTSGVDSSPHIFADCMTATNCWNISGINVVYRQNIPFHDWILYNLNSLTDEDSCIFIMICWSLWTAKNDKLRKNKSTPLSHIVERVRGFLSTWREAQLHNINPSAIIIPHAVRWSKPRPGWLKINIDS